MSTRSILTIMVLIIFFCPGPLPAKSELPHEFVKLVPLYPSAQVVETRYTRNNVSVRFATDDNFERVSGFYAKALDKAGWRILPVATDGVIKAEKVDAGKNDLEISIVGVFSKGGHPSSFIIDLYYPGGRE